MPLLFGFRSREFDSLFENEMKSRRFRASTEEIIRFQTSQIGTKTVEMTTNNETTAGIEPTTTEIEVEKHRRILTLRPTGLAEGMMPFKDLPTAETSRDRIRSIHSAANRTHHPKN